MHNNQILVVDDNAINRLLAISFCKKIGLSPLEVDNGPGAIEIASREPLAAILLDISMPCMNGEDVFVELRNRGVQTPVIAYTAHAFDETTDNLMKLGFCAVITKPTTRDRFESVMAKVLAD